MDEKKKKKHGCLIAVIVIVALIVIASVVGGNAGKSSNSATNNTGNGSSTTQSSTEDNTNQETQTSITEEKYNQIENGMSYEEVKNIIGSDGENISESEISGIKTVTYQWDSDTLGTAIILFENDKVTNKSQYGISDGDDVTVTADMYNQVTTGMTYEEVKQIFGGEGSPLSDTEIAGQTSQIYQWNGNSLGSNCTITFSDGKVLSKAQYGLE